MRVHDPLGVSDYQPFIDDLDHERLVNGERYVVLRPTGIVSRAYAEVQAAVRTKLSGSPVSYPAQGHVTMKGFPSGTALIDVQKLVRQWTARVPPVPLEVDRVTSFGTPHKIVIVQVRKTPELFRAFTTLHDLAKQHGLPDWPDGAVPRVEDWIFHMSVAYCSSLADQDWEVIARLFERCPIPPVDGVIAEAEIAAFDGGQEYSGGAFQFTGRSISKTQALSE